MMRLAVVIAALGLGGCVYVYRAPPSWPQGKPREPRTLVVCIMARCEVQTPETKAPPDGGAESPGKRPN